jgi:hypothetical protein
MHNTPQSAAMAVRCSWKDMSLILKMFFYACAGCDQCTYFITNQVGKQDVGHHMLRTASDEDVSSSNFGGWV